MKIAESADLLVPLLPGRLLGEYFDEQVLGTLPEEARERVRREWRWLSGRGPLLDRAGSARRRELGRGQTGAACGLGDPRLELGPHRRLRRLIGGELRPGGDRREEVYACCELLQSLGLRSFSPSVTACPGCGRTTSTTFQELAERIQGYIRDMMPIWKTQYEGVESMTLAVMGCIVNGPGESKAANIGISLPGTGEAPRCPVYIDGRKSVTLEGTYDELAAAFQKLVDDYISTKYPKKAAEAVRR